MSGGQTNCTTNSYTSKSNFIIVPPANFINVLVFEGIALINTSPQTYTVMSIQCNRKPMLTHTHKYRILNLFSCVRMD